MSLAELSMDPRHQKYLEPIIRFLQTDLRLILNYPATSPMRDHIAQRALHMVDRAIAEIDGVVQVEEKGYSFERTIQRIDANSQCATIELHKQIVELVETGIENVQLEQHLNSWLTSTEDLATKNLLPPVILT